MRLRRLSVIAYNGPCGGVPGSAAVTDRRCDGDGPSHLMGGCRALPIPPTVLILTVAVMLAAFQLIPSAGFEWRARYLMPSEGQSTQLVRAASGCSVPFSHSKHTCR